MSAPSIYFLIRLFPGNSYLDLEIISGTNLPTETGRTKQFIYFRDQPVAKGDLENGSEYYFLGDPIFYLKGPTELLNTAISPGTRINSDILKMIKGHFYLIILDRKLNSISVYNSLFSILPVYYYMNKSEIVVSSRQKLILESTHHGFSVNKTWVLQKVLYNYPLDNQSCFNEILLLPCNCFLVVGDNIRIEKLLSIQNHIPGSPAENKKSVNRVVESLIFNVLKYIPASHFALSFTSGFDGRTLLAIAMSSGRLPLTFAFGTRESDDIMIPMEQSGLLSLEFLPIVLDEKYCEEEFYSSAEAVIELSEGNSSFARAHYHYAVKKIAKFSDIMITGNFGSELFRAMHTTGAMVSQNLVNYYKSGTETEIINSVHNSPDLDFLPRENYREELDRLTESLLSSRKSFSNDFDRNRSFYAFVFEEIFRKYFGPEIVMQSHYLRNRTPFLDFDFISDLLQIKLAGVHSRFYEHNPLKRMKGQELYARVIKKTSKELFKLETGRGYRPEDILSAWGKLSLLKKYIRKRSGREGDIFAVQKGYLDNAIHFKKWPIREDLFNKDRFNLTEKDHSSMKKLVRTINILSMNHYLNSMTG